MPRQVGANDSAGEGNLGGLHRRSEGQPPFRRGLFGFRPVSGLSKVATGTDFGLRIWNAADGKPAVALDQTSSGVHQVQAIAFAPVGKTVLTADSPGLVRLFDTADGKELRAFQMPAVGGQTTVSGLGITTDVPIKP